MRVGDVLFRTELVSVHMLSISLASDGDDVASMAWTLNVTYPVASRFGANVRVLRTSIPRTHEASQKYRTEVLWRSCLRLDLLESN